MCEDARPSDLPAIGALNVAAYAEFASALAPDDWRVMEKNLAHPERVAERARFLVVRADEGLAGSVAYCPAGRSVDPIPAEWASVLLLAVAPHHRGRGHAEALVRECLRRATADRAAIIGLYTSERMLSAQRLYARLGFVRESEIKPRYGLRYFRYRRQL